MLASPCWPGVPCWLGRAPTAASPLRVRDGGAPSSCSVLLTVRASQATPHPARSTHRKRGGTNEPPRLVIHSCSCCTRCCLFPGCERALGAVAQTRRQVSPDLADSATGNGIDARHWQLEPGV